MCNGGVGGGCLCVVKKIKLLSKRGNNYLGCGKKN